MRQLLKPFENKQMAMAPNLIIAAGAFINACLIVEIFHQDTRWLLGRATLEASARTATVYTALSTVVSLALLFSGSLKFRKKHGWGVFFQSALLLGGSVVLTMLGLLSQSRAFNQYISGGMFALPGTSFFLWALLPFAGFLLLCRSLDRSASKTSR